MRPAVPSALLIAGLFACAGYSSGNLAVGDSGVPVGGFVDGGPDAGPDAGPDGGNGGSDAGCTPRQLNPTGMIDSCFGTGSQVPGSVSVTLSSCTVNINTGTNVCTGDVRGTGDAFDGGCGGYLCTSPSLPGTIVCNTSSTTSCTIVVCDGGC